MIIVGDPQACFKTLRSLAKKFPKNERVCVVGDLIDKGPNARDTVQFVIDQGWDCTMGNHEQSMLNDGCGIRIKGQWNGVATIRSYAENPEDEALFEQHCRWIRQLPYYLEYPDVVNEAGQYLLVSHAGIPYDDLAESVRSRQILWNRAEVPVKYKNAFNVFGHTPVPNVFLGDYYANVDTGCFFTDPGYGRLSALRFPQMEIYEQENIDRQWHMGMDAKKRYYILNDIPAADESLWDFSTKQAALRWAAKHYYPETSFRLVHGEEVDISPEEKAEALAHVSRGGSWMDILTKQEWDGWAHENLTEQQRKIRLSQCRACNIDNKPPTVYCRTCGRLPDDAIFKRV